MPAKKSALWICVVLAVIGIGAGFIATLSPHHETARTNPILENGNFGRVQVGMTLTEIEQALGAKLASFDPGFNTECWYTRRSDGAEPYVGYMVSDGKIVRIDIRYADPEQKIVPPVTDSKGFGISSSEKSLVDAYGSVMKVSPHKYGDADDHTLRVESPDGKTALLFETWDGKVSTFRTGIAPYVDYVEGCS